MSRPPDLVYGHFLYQAGRAAVVVGQALRCPSVVGVGEGKFWTVDPIGRRKAARDFRGVTGVLAVSTPIREGLIRELSIPEAKIRIFPNGVDLHLYAPRPRAEMCARYGIPQDTFNIAFVGQFDHLKGADRLAAAAGDLPDVRLLFLGDGDVRFETANTAFKGLVAHAQVPELLSAADLFVLPTAEEGSCNALLEAMACGLPIVTSNGDYTADLVDDSVACRVDPYDVAALRAGILALKDDPARRASMSRACLRRAQSFDLRTRAGRVSEWLESFMVKASA
jgi:glycosyltransferase involved in cell wall biosynthesis